MKTPCDTPAVLLADKLHFQYLEPALFTNFSVRVMPGVTLVCGGSGRGKSTLLRLLAGVQPLSAGQLHIHGISLQDEPEAYRQQVLWTEPRSTVFDELTALQYFELQRRTYGGFTTSHLAGLIKGLILEPHVNKPLYMLSTGSKRKVWLAAAFASHAAVALLDDPFAALDKPSIRFVADVLRRLAKQSERAVVITGYAAPDNLALAGLIDLGD